MSGENKGGDAGPVGLEEAAPELLAHRDTLEDSAAGAVASLAMELDPDHLEGWLDLAAEVGDRLPLRLLESGRQGISALVDVQRALESRREAEEDNRRWLEAEGRGKPHKVERVPLLTVPDDDGRDRPYLPGGVVGIVAAKGGTGKTTWLAELAMRVAWGSSGESWPPYKVEPYAEGPVILFLAEEDADGVNAALHRGLKRTKGSAAEAITDEEWNARVVALGGADRNTSLGLMVTTDDPVRGKVTQVVASPLLEMLMKHARTMGPSLVVLDPINQLLPVGVSENDAVAAKAIIELAGKLRLAAEEGRRNRWAAEKAGRKPEGYDGPRPVVLLAHHERKGADADAGADAIRGSSAFVDNARWVMRLTRERRGEEERGFFGLVKSNYTRQWSHRAVVVYSDGLEWKRESAEEAARWAELGEKGGEEKWTAEELAERLRAKGSRGMALSEADKMTLTGAIEEAERAGLVRREKNGPGFTLYAVEFAPEAVEEEEGGEL